LIATLSSSPPLGISGVDAQMGQLWDGMPFFVSIPARPQVV
jgi:hypothetical protein